MKTICKLAIAAASLGLALAPEAKAWHGGWSVGIRIGGPIYVGPWYPYPYYYQPYPVYVAPAPVVVEQVPAPRVASAYAAPAPAVVARSQSPDVTRVDTDRYVQALKDANESIRIESVMQLGRMKADGAIDPIAATLAGDRSPAVREAAARALGLIGSPHALPALQHAAQADSDRDVRHSAQFAVDIVNANR
jgi:hypothetical protein